MKDGSSTSNTRLSLKRQNREEKSCKVQNESIRGDMADVRLSALTAFSGRRRGTSSLKRAYHVAESVTRVHASYDAPRAISKGNETKCNQR